MSIALRESIFADSKAFFIALLSALVFALEYAMFSMFKNSSFDGIPSFLSLNSEPLKLTIEKKIRKNTAEVKTYIFTGCRYAVLRTALYSFERNPGLRTRCLTVSKNLLSKWVMS